MKNSNDTIGNRTRKLPTCSAVPQPTTLPRAPIFKYINTKNIQITIEWFCIDRPVYRFCIDIPECGLNTGCYTQRMCEGN